MMTDEQAKCLELQRSGLSYKQIADEMGISMKGVKSRLEKARKWEKAPWGVKNSLENVGIGVEHGSHGWRIRKTPDGGRDSVFWSFPKVTIEETKAQMERILEDIREMINAERPDLPARFETTEGNLLFLSPADVHIGKLSIMSETGVTYNSDIAAHRLTEGCKALVTDGAKHGVTQIAFILGNDIGHIDRADKRTTAGTPQDVDGTIFSIHKAAVKGYIDAITWMLSQGYDVHLYFCPSNHDWILGYGIAQTVWAWFHDHPNVHASAYTMSECHRKYIRFGSSNIGITHGDGAKENDLPQIMIRETGRHAAETLHHYWYIHHYHHKIKKNAGLNSQAREKDHIAMTAMHLGVGAMEGDNASIEVIRSPSAPDGWHHRNGYLNRQAVEAFVHSIEDGQVARFTKWF